MSLENNFEDKNKKKKEEKEEQDVESNEKEKDVKQDVEGDKEKEEKKENISEENTNKVIEIIENKEGPYSLEDVIKKMDELEGLDYTRIAEACIKFATYPAMVGIFRNLDKFKGIDQFEISKLAIDKSGCSACGIITQKLDKFAKKYKNKVIELIQNKLDENKEQEVFKQKDKKVSKQKENINEENTNKVIKAIENNDSKLYKSLKLEGLDYDRIVKAAFDSGKDYLVFIYLDDFKGIDQFEISKLAIDRFGYNACSSIVHNLNKFAKEYKNKVIELVQDKLNEKKEIDLDKFAIPKEYIDDILTHDFDWVMKHLDNFKGVDHNEIAKLLIESGNDTLVAYFIDKFKDINYDEIADFLVENKKSSAVLYNLEKFKGVDHNRIINLIIKKGQGSVIVDYLDHLKDVDHNEIAKLLVKNGEDYAVAYNLENFKNIDYNEIAKFFVENGKGKTLLFYLNNFKGIDYHEIAKLLIKKGFALEVERKLKEFKGVSEEELQELLDKYSSLEYRNLLEEIKSKEGNISGVEYRDPNEIIKDYDKELETLVETVISEKTEEDSAQYIKDLAAKLGLPEEMVKEVYQLEEENIISEAKQEINKESSIWKKLGKTAAKSAIYVGAGVLSTTSAVASLGLGLGVSAGIIAGARVLDRAITEKRLKKKLDAKVEEVKKRKRENEEEKENLKQRLAMSFSIKKKLQIDAVDLNKEGEDKRRDIIYSYVDDYAEKARSYYKEEKREKYKDNLSRALIGLDNIDRMNRKEEERVNKKGVFDKLNNLEKVLSGKGAKEKVTSTAVLVGLGMVARELPVVRSVLMGWAGWRVGAIAADLMTKKNKGDMDETYDSLKSINQRAYTSIRQRLLDPDLQKNNPEKYLEYKRKVEKYENEMAERGAHEDKYIDSINNINTEFEKENKQDVAFNKIERDVKIAVRAMGAVLGVVAGQFAADILHDLDGHQSSHNVPKTDSHNVLDHNIKHVPKESTLNNVANKTKVDTSNVSKASSPDTLNQSVDHAPKVAVNKESSIDSVNQVKANTPVSKADSSNIIDHKGTSSNTLEQKVNSSPKVVKDGKTYWVNEINNKDMPAGGHDSVWHSTEQIFHDNAKELGYKGDINNDAQLNDWARHQTANALNKTVERMKIMRNSNNVTLNDKVFQGNKINLFKDENGHFVIKIEKADGLAPGKLHPEVKTEAIPVREVKTPIQENIKPEGIKVDKMVNDNIITNAKHRRSFGEVIKGIFSRKKASNSSLDHSVLDGHNTGVHVSSEQVQQHVDVIGKKVTSSNDYLNFDHNHNAPLGSERAGDYDHPEFNAGTNHIQDHIDVIGKKVEANPNIETSGHNTTTGSSLDNGINVHQEHIDVVGKKVGANINDEGVENIVLGKHVDASNIKSLDDLNSLQNNVRLKLNNLMMVKKDNVIHFTTKDGTNFKMIVNKFGNSSDNFSIQKNNVELGKLGNTEEIRKALDLKRLVYNNLSDKNSSLARKLHEDIINDQDLIKSGNE